jgi:catechol 2,3-dioxygenase-like lactoylglutathione lyase family enzyme
MKSVGAITLFVADPQRSKAFYESVFGLAPAYEDESSAAFNFDNMIVNLLAVSAAHDLIEPATVAGPETGSRFQLTIWVDDTDAVCAELRSRHRATQRADGPRMGSAHCQLQGSRRPHLGSRAAARVVPRRYE